MDDNKVSFFTYGEYEGGALKVLERRGGRAVYIWRGFFDGGNLVRIYPDRPIGASRDGIKREAKKLSIWEIERLKE